MPMENGSIYRTRCEQPIKADLQTAGHILGLLITLFVCRFRHPIQILMPSSFGHNKKTNLARASRTELF